MKPKVAVIGVKGIPGYGGSSSTNKELLPLLAKNYDITIYAIDTHAKQKHYKGVKQYIFRSIRNKKLNSIFYYLKAVIHVIIRGNFKFIHLNHGVSGIIIPILKLRYGVITSIHGLNFKDDDKWNNLEYNILKCAEWITFNLSDIVTTVQKSSVSYIVDKTKKPVVYIPNGIFNYNLEYPNIEKENVITLSAARLIYLKGVHTFLEALQLINFKDIVRIIGDIDQVPEYKKKIISLTKGLNVEFTGLIKNRDTLFRKISSSRIYVFPSYSEGMSNMLLEVASLKVPIIASDITPNKDIFDDDEVVYFAVGDSNQLANKIEKCWNDQGYINKFAEKAHKKVTDKYNWEKVASMYDANYRKLI